MRRFLITFIAAAVVTSGGVAYGVSTRTDHHHPRHQGNQNTSQQSCEAAVNQFRNEHPEGYSTDCNHGEATKTVP